ncbi:MAG: exopolysaccharide biosynthesis polyprenyl glycosylphosphotransferase [Vicinamibacteria bacterium]|nr:exopolysaccharide biosynthesis polyprenyl glycosylphosphotransferase [Vicinamibacteria bacterium]
MTRGRHFERAVVAFDLVVVVAAVVASYALASRLHLVSPALRRVVPAGEVAHLLAVFVPAWALGAQRVGLHGLRLLRGPWLDLLRATLLAQAIGAGALAVILVLAQAPLNRTLIALFLLLSTALLLFAKAVQRRRAIALGGEALALVLGPVGEAEEGDLARLRGRRIERLASESPAALVDRLRRGGVDEVILAADPNRSHTRLLPLLEACEEVGVPALVEVEQAGLEVARPRAEVVGDRVYLAYETQDADRPERFVKNLFDRATAAVLLALLLPLLALLVVLIRLDSRGPALFWQWRGGLNGRRFRMLKFRTMREGAEAERDALLAHNEMDGPVFKLGDDPRVTRLGRALRRWSLDELPQLVNVLRGEMSLVGPRPLPMVETDALDGWRRRRLSVKPGLTGLWQVSGRNDLGFEEWMKLDLAYVDNWSLGLDLAILLRTLPAVLSRRGAK